MASQIFHGMIFAFYLRGSISYLKKMRGAGILPSTPYFQVGDVPTSEILVSRAQISPFANKNTKRP